MSDELFDDEMDLTERGADENSSPRLAIASQPIRDGSRALLHDGYDVQLFHEAAGEYPKLAELLASARERLITAPALICDIFWSFYKHAPEIHPVVPLTLAHQIHANILEHLMATREWKEVRAAGTIGDVFNSAVATIGAAENAIGALSAAVVAEINHLHELHSGASDLFAQAQALADEAEQAEGDAGAELFAQAASARTEAEELERAQHQAAEEIATQAEQIEDATRRAARTGLRAAAEAIEESQAAIQTFGGGYGPGLGLENGVLSTKEKIALATQVGRSRRLKQVAALCGRLTRIALHVQSTKVQYPPDEVADIKYGSDIGHVLPSELALLADLTLEELFFHRYAEGQLMQYELLGNEKQGQGPIILAVDTSGSMAESLGGITKDIWAKAVMLALMAIARLQERDMVAFLFSGSAHEITRFDFPKGRAPHQTVITAVETFYNGGTVFEPWMAAALNAVDEAQFNRADVIAATDGLTSIAAATCAEWQRRRVERGMRAYGILLGTREGMHALASITDAVMTIDNLQDDMPVLQTIFAI
jgi:uncharacterized protein with von Willebrand factor type A (vWA) domain